MTFQEAKDELLTLAKGEYCSLWYELTLLRFGEEISKCKVYVDKHQIHTGTTWREALDSLKRELNPQPADITEMPTEELLIAKAA